MTNRSDLKKKKVEKTEGDGQCPD